MLTSMTNSDLRSEVDALRQDLYRHRDRMNRGGPHFEANVELYKMKISRLDVFQAFVNAQFIISKMEQSAFYAAQVERRRARRRRQRKNIRPAEIQPTFPELKPLVTPTDTGPEPGVIVPLLNKIKIENMQIAIVEDSQSRKRKRSRADRRRAKKAKLLEVKLEDIKQEIE